LIGLIVGVHRQPGLRLYRKRIRGTGLSSSPHHYSGSGFLLGEREDKEHASLIVLRRWWTDNDQHAARPLLGRSSYPLVVGQRLDRVGDQLSIFLSMIFFFFFAFVLTYTAHLDFLTHTPAREVCGGAGCPYSNVQAAIQAAQAGDLVRILAGEYTESLITVSVTPLYIEYRPASNPEEKNLN